MPDLNLTDGHGWTLRDEFKAEHAVPPTRVLSVGDEQIHARRLRRASAPATS